MDINAWSYDSSSVLFRQRSSKLLFTHSPTLRAASFRGAPSVVPPLDVAQLSPANNKGYTQPVLWSSIWCRNFRRALRLYAFVTSLLLHVEKIHCLLFIDFTIIVYCYYGYLPILWHVWFQFVAYYSHISHIKDIFNYYYSAITVFSVLIVFNDTVLSLPSTIYALRSTILCMDVDSYSYCSKY